MHDSTHSPKTFSRVNAHANCAPRTTWAKGRVGTTRDPWRSSLTNIAASQRPTRRSGHSHLSCTLFARPDRFSLLFMGAPTLSIGYTEQAPHTVFVRQAHLKCTQCHGDTINCLAPHRTHYHRRSMRANVAKAFPHNAASLTVDGHPTRGTITR
jgi:hypothetical protein